jgi:hypothetical protein
LVAMAAMEMAVVRVMAAQVQTTWKASIPPASPEIHVSLRKSWTPRMFWMQGRKTPANVDRPVLIWTPSGWSGAWGRATS